MCRHRSRTRQLNDKDGSGFSPPAYMTRTMSISDSIAPANKQERELSQGLLLDILETDSEDDIALKNLRKKLVADMKKEKLQGQSKVPALTKQDTDNLMEKLQRVESPPLKNNSHDQFDGISLSHFTLTKQMNWSSNEMKWKLIEIDHVHFTFQKEKVAKLLFDRNNHNVFLRYELIRSWKKSHIIVMQVKRVV